MRLLSKRFLFLSVPALRIGDSNALSQYPKYQSVSIITISSRRDPTVSPILSAVCRRKLQRPFIQGPFNNPSFSLVRQRQADAKLRTWSTKTGQVVKCAWSATVRSIARRVVGLRETPEENSWNRRARFFFFGGGSRICCPFWCFYVTAVITLLGAESPLRAMTQLRFVS